MGIYRSNREDSLGITLDHHYNVKILGSLKTHNIVKEIMIRAFEPRTLE